VRDQFDGVVTFSDWVRHLRLWLAKRDIPDRERIVIEVRFPDARSQYYAYAELARELATALALTGGSFPTSTPIRPQTIQIEGVNVSFDNSERLEEIGRENDVG
jgi:hypothetical protein